MEHKHTKRTLIASIIALILCISMFAGSTFAWFTDNATTGVNTIIAGTLDIDLVDANGESLEGKTVGFVNATENTRWEPGCRYTLQEVKLVNNGNLAAKYKVHISAVEGDAKLSEVIDVYEGETKLGTLDNFLNNTIKEGVINANEALSFGTLTFVMQTSAGNEYQGASIENIAITVLATQATVENDSMDNTYDDGAEFAKADEYKSYGYEIEVTETAEQMASVLASASATEPVAVVVTGEADTYAFPLTNIQHKNVAFVADGTKTFDATTFNVNMTQGLQFSTLTFDGVNVEFPANSWFQNGYTGLNVQGGKLVFKNCTVTGAQYLYTDVAEFINCTFENGANSYSVCTYAAKEVYFTDCIFNTAGKAVLLYNDGPVTTEATFTNCTFNSDASAADDKAAVETGDDGSKGSKFTLSFTNCVADGFVTNNSSSNLWANKVNSNMPADRLIVIIEGEKVDITANLSTGNK